MKFRGELTVGAVIDKVFPHGTREYGEREVENPSAEPPVFATDVFAVSVYLIEISGLMGFFEVRPKEQERFQRGKLPRVSLSTEEKENCSRASEAWRSSMNGCAGDERKGKTKKTGGKAASAPPVDPVPPLVNDLWAQLIAAIAEPVRPSAFIKNCREDEKDTEFDVPNWWRVVFQLAIIADEACDGLGHFFLSDEGKYTRREKSHDGANDLVNELNTLDAQLAHSRLIERKQAPDPKGGDISRRLPRGDRSWARLADPQVVCVFPKGRVTQLGCSVRNLSRNLAMVGPSGAVRCSWEQLLGNTNIEDLRETLNIVMIPWPTTMDAKHFAASDEPETFEIDQTWLKGVDDGKIMPRKTPKQIGVSDGRVVSDILKIIKKAARETGRIDAVIFPELALNWDIFELLFDAIRDDPELGKHFKFLIAGSTTNCEAQSGNFVLTGICEDKLVESVDQQPGPGWYQFSQAKHHRWRIERNQLQMYALGSELSPEVNWWEKHEIGPRELNFFQLRTDTVFASLVCEDLARNDPCHDIMRSVSPNLIFALLMDGPQLPARWPARYAGSLADDPGSTVITFTSYGLVGRANSQHSGQPSHSVGLVRDSKGNTVPLNFKPDASAILLTLGSEAVTEHTIDKRRTRHTSEWFYMSHRLIK